MFVRARLIVNLGYNTFLWDLMMCNVYRARSWSGVDRSGSMEEGGVGQGQKLSANWSHT